MIVLLYLANENLPSVVLNYIYIYIYIHYKEKFTVLLRTEQARTGIICLQ